MALPEDRTAAFIVRVWCEHNRGAVPPLEWRASIEHVASSRRLYFRDTAVIAAFIQPYIDTLLEGTPPQ